MITLIYETKTWASTTNAQYIATFLSFNIIKGDDIHDWVEMICSSPRNKKNSKHPTGENVVPRERTIKLNPNRRNQGGIPKK